MRRLSPLLLGLGIFFVAACASSGLNEPLTELPKLQANRIQAAMLNADYSQVLRLTENSNIPLFQLANHKALYELESYDTLLQSSAILDPRFKSYDTLLRTLAAFDSKHWAILKAIQIPDDLPRIHREHLSFLKADALRETGPVNDAIEAYETFLKDYRGWRHEADAILRLAELKWNSDAKSDSLQLYERIYKFFPNGEGDELARQRLLDAGRYDELDTDVHLSRIQKLQHAALFDKAERELESLRKKVNPEAAERIDLAMTKLLFAHRSYTKSEAAARAGLKLYKNTSHEADWREMLALSLTRLGKPEDGVKEYQQLLRLDIPGSLRELVLFRLGNIALDNADFGTASDYFKKLRTEYADGNYIESAHWFGAWALFLEQRAHQKTWSLEQRNHNLQLAIKLTSKISSLPSGQALEPQALYWQAEFARDLDQNELSTQSLDKLKATASLSYYALLLKDNPFAFLAERNLKSLSTAPSVQEVVGNNFRHELNWQRLEGFRSLGIQSWAQPELDIFLSSSRRQDMHFKTMVAERLAQIQDWGDLVKWADRYFEKPTKNEDLNVSTARYHYPLTYKETVLKAAREFDLSPFLVWGLMREESRFDEGALSRVGAVGLMQMMLPLGERIARAIGDGTVNRVRLADPKRNIRYGAFHLRELKRQVERMPVPEDLKPAILIASYNAGIEAVQRWLREKESTTADLFIDSIPYTETRLYVKRVLQSAHIYFQLYGDHDKEVARTKGKQNL